MYEGLWKHLIRLTKTALQKVLGKAFITLPVLQTIIVETEAVLNGRPLAYISSDLNDPHTISFTLRTKHHLLTT